MADPTDIELKLKTTGDTSGAEAVEKSLFAVEDAGKQASRQADVDIVKARQAVEVQKQQAAALREIADGQQRIIAAKLAEQIGAITSKFGELGPEARLATDGLNSFLTTLATTGNPVVAILSTVGVAVAGVVTAYSDAAKKIKEINKQEKENLKELADLREEFAAQIRTEKLEEFFRRETAALAEQERVLERIVKLTASERALAAQQQASAGAAAVAAGASPEGVAAGQQLTATNNQVAALNADLKKSQSAVATAVELAGTLKLAADALVLNQGEGGDKALKAVAAAKQAADDAERLRADEAINQRVILNQIETALDAGKQAVEETSREGLDALTESVSRQRDALKAEVARLGDGASSGAREAVMIFEKALEDSKIGPEDLARIAEAQARVRLSQEALNTEVKKGFDDTAQALDSTLNIIAPALAKISDLSNQLTTLRADVTKLQIQRSE